MGKLKTRTFVLIFLALAAVCVLWLFLQPRGSAQTVRVLLDGETAAEIDLAAVTEPYTLPVGEHNVLEVTRGGVRMLKSDCPDGSCLRQGTAEPGKPVICLPNRVVVETTGKKASDVDAVVG
ncbi:MAG: NusG domain II-containing protein [Clostridiaceae bacterium]|nr:NusG domain II-containing protein [Clostridiaceae bacterium]